ncbi:MAG: hypothetical protein HQL31_09280 [Planctomycetes bacterium]|nr:hypothetical protein [Planctomycetota bacterium]
MKSLINPIAALVGVGIEWWLAITIPIPIPTQTPIMNQASVHLKPRYPQTMNIAEEILSLLKKASAGGVLSFDEGLELYRRASTRALVQAATQRTARLWGGKGGVRTYMLYLLVNYTNVCTCACTFCNFSVSPGSPKARRSSMEGLRPLLESYHKAGGRIVMIQGGHDEEIASFSHYTSLVKGLLRLYPDLLVFGFSPSEIAFWSRKYALSRETILSELKAAGLRAIAGGGAEIAHEPIRKLICPGKVPFGEWLEIMEAAAASGLMASASMMYGTYDGADERFEAEFCRLEHMDLLRQSQSRHGQFRAFVTWPYQPNQGRIRAQPAPYEDYVRVLSMARLYMGNFPNIQSSYLSLTREQFAESLAYGSNCAGGLLFTPELVTGSVGANPNHLNRSQMEEWIRAGGFVPEERDYYGRLLSDPYGRVIPPAAGSTHSPPAN